MPQSFLITYTNQNTQISAPFNHNSTNNTSNYSDITRLSKQQARNIYRTRSMYAQKRPIQLFEPEKLIQEPFQLIQALRYGKVRQFQILYPKQAEISGVNRLMFDLFTLGKTFSPSFYIPNLLRDRDCTGKTPLHYAAAGGVNLTEGGVKNRIVNKLIKIQDNNGVSALMISCFLGRSENVAPLWSEVSLRDIEGRTCIFHAAMGQKAEIVVKLWKELGNSIDEMGRDIWNYMSKYGIRTKVENLLMLRYGKESGHQMMNTVEIDEGMIDRESRMEEMQYVSIKFD